MQKKKGYFVSSVVFIALLISVLGASFVFARGPASGTIKTNAAPSAQSAVASMDVMQTLNMQSVPAGPGASIGQPAKQMPLLTGNPALYAQHKAAAVDNANAPFVAGTPTNATAQVANVRTTSANATPVISAQFQGMADSN